MAAANAAGGILSLGAEAGRREAAPSPLISNRRPVTETRSKPAGLKRA